MALCRMCLVFISCFVHLVRYLHVFSALCVSSISSIKLCLILLSKDFWINSWFNTINIDMFCFKYNKKKKKNNSLRTKTLISIVLSELC